MTSETHPTTLFPPGPPSPLVLAPGDLHLWAARLDLPQALVEKLYGKLSEDERIRAARFSLEHLRRRYIVGRGRLRVILAGYLGSDPVEIQFDYQDRGKPVLASAWRSSGLHFNLSHSHGLALLAVAHRELGVDVEWLRPVATMPRLVERYFADEEQRQWRQLPAESRETAFFQAWTRKEAWLKAVGSGLTFPLDQVQVSLAPDQPARFLSVRGDVREAAAWWLDSCEPAAAYVAAVAMLGRPLKVSYWLWPE